MSASGRLRSGSFVVRSQDDTLSTPSRGWHRPSKHDDRYKCDAGNYRLVVVAKKMPTPNPTSAAEDKGGQKYAGDNSLSDIRRARKPLVFAVIHLDGM